MATIRIIIETDEGEPIILEERSTVDEAIDWLKKIKKIFGKATTGGL